MQPYPWTVDVYLGEERMVIMPYLKHSAGYRTTVDFAISINDYTNKTKIGQAVLDAFAFISKHPITDKSVEIWSAYTKYKSWKGFCHHNYCVEIQLNEASEYILRSMQPEKSVLGFNGYVDAGIRLTKDACSLDFGNAILKLIINTQKYMIEHPISKKTLIVL